MWCAGHLGYAVERVYYHLIKRGDLVPRVQSPKKGVHNRRGQGDADAIVNLAYPQVFGPMDTVRHRERHPCKARHFFLKNPPTSILPRDRGINNKIFVPFLYVDMNESTV